MFDERTPTAPTYSDAPLVCVVLSTHNGARYIYDLLRSLVNQEYSALRILVRDDGSTDKTLSIVESYARVHKNIDIITGDNIGFNGSYFELLRQAPDDAEYFAFCDQDDVWDADKIANAVYALQEKATSVPAMYCSRVRIVDENLEPLSFLQLAVRGPSFENALVENIAPGCTIVLNTHARRLLISRLPNMNSVFSYDWWTYLVLSAFGHVVYDRHATLAYRQHASNAFGASTGIWRWLRRLERFRKSDYRFGIFEQASEFLCIFGDSLSADRRKVLEEFLLGIRDRSVLRRLRYAFKSKVHRQSMTDNVLLKWLVCAGRV